MDVAPRKTHRMTFPHNNGGIVRSAWTMSLFKNGDLVLDIPIEVVEISTQIYQFTFDNDGEHESEWSLIVYETANPDIRYGETWLVRRKIVEQALEDIKTRLINSEGGYIGSDE